MLSKLKLLLGITDTAQDDRLTQLISMASDRLCVLLGEESVPEELEDIVVEACVVRFNRIGSEGLASHTVEGETLSFTGGDFDGCMDEIQAWIDGKSNKRQGKVVFL